jgi:hypothetical protein
MITVPPETPATTPVLFTVAFPLLALHVPPPTLSDSVIVAPTFTEDEPVIVPALGKGIIVTVWVAVAVPQLLLTVYDIAVVPAAKPVTIPVLPTVAIDGPEDDHVPPEIASVSVIVLPAQTVDGPVMTPALGEALTVNTFVAATLPQPFVTVYEMIVVPADIVITRPLELIVATAVLLLLHTPPATESVIVTGAPVQIDEDRILLLLRVMD